MNELIYLYININSVGARSTKPSEEENFSSKQFNIDRNML